MSIEDIKYKREIEQISVQKEYDKKSSYEEKLCFIYDLLLKIKKEELEYKGIVIMH